MKNKNILLKLFFKDSVTQPGVTIHSRTGVKLYKNQEWSEHGTACIWKIVYLYII